MLNATNISSLIGILLFLFFRRIDFGFFISIILAYLGQKISRQVISSYNDRRERIQLEKEHRKKEKLLQEQVLQKELSMTPEEKEMVEKMDKAYKDLMKIRSGYECAKHEIIKEEAKELYETGVQIFNHLNSNPEKITMANRYLNYYLDTASKIMEKYKTFLNLGFVNDEVEEVYDETEKALKILNDAFERQFVNLLKNDMMEIEASVKVLESVYESEESGV